MLLDRLAKTSRATDLTGEGAKRAGGRWNFAGTPVIYTAQSGALAILEVLQYAQESDIRLFFVLTIDVPDSELVQQVLVSIYKPTFLISQFLVQFFPQFSIVAGGPPLKNDINGFCSCVI